MKKICPLCGHEFREGSFCLYCGTELVKANVKPKRVVPEAYTKKAHGFLRIRRGLPHLTYQQWRILNEDSYSFGVPLQCEIYLNGKPLSDLRMDD